MRTTTARVAGAALALLLGLAPGGAASASERGDEHDPNPHRRCAELIHREGGRVFVDGVAHPASEFTLDELLELPAHCPELGSNALLHPPGQD